MKRLRFRFLLLPSSSLLIVALGGCAAPVYVEEVEPPIPVAASTDEGVLKSVLEAPARDPRSQIGSILTVLRPVAKQIEDGRFEAIPEYNFLVARLAEHLDSIHKSPWQRSMSVEAGSTRRLLLGRQPPDFDISRETLLPCDSLALRGEYVSRRAIRDGVGAPLVLHLPNPGRDEQVFRNLTAIIRFAGSSAIIDLEDPLQTDMVSFGSKRLALNADFSAAICYSLATDRIDKDGLRRLVDPGGFDHTAEIRFLQPYDPERIPVVFVHGLMDTPASFTPMFLNLISDPVVRQEYQFWVFSYPSGYPYPLSASVFRKELERIFEVHPKTKNLVVIGHSMGGLISRTLVTNSGDSIWISFFGKPPERTDFQDTVRESLEDALILRPQKNVGRVIFMSAPHRGSDLASSWVGRMGTKLVRLPKTLIKAQESIVLAIADDPPVEVFDDTPSSIDTLSPNDRFILAINELPLSPKVPFHSIIGDRGKKGLRENSSDGVVGYWASHLEGAASEKIVPSDHGSHRNPEAIEEVRRILLRHLKK